jgi:hypothetical protein
MTLLIRFVVLVAAIAVLMLAKYVWHAPEWTVFVIAGAEILVLVGVTTFTAIAARRRLTRQAPPS